MDKREMAKSLRDGAFGNGPALGDVFIVRRCAAEAGAAALEREAEREEKERPKVTLHEMREAVINAEHCDKAGEDEPLLKAAASTLKRLAEEGGKMMHDHYPKGKCACDGCRLLRSLGCEAKP